MSNLNLLKAGNTIKDQAYRLTIKLLSLKIKGEYTNPKSGSVFSENSRWTNAMYEIAQDHKYQDGDLSECIKIIRDTTERLKMTSTVFNYLDDLECFVKGY